MNLYVFKKKIVKSKQFVDSVNSIVIVIIFGYHNYSV